MTLYILMSICLFFSFLNFVFIIFLSNFIFRFFVNSKPSTEKLPNNINSGLVDLKPTVTYDPRFKN